MIGRSLAMLCLSVAAPLSAQDRGRPPAAEADEAPPVVLDARVARTADVDAGRIGQRQTRAEASRATGAEPLTRIETRVANRVQNRLRSRIDRNYDPQANTTSPFVVAADQVRANRRRR